MDSPKTVPLTPTLTTISSTVTLPTSLSESPWDSFSEFVDNILLVEPNQSDYGAATGFIEDESPPLVFSSPELNAENVDSMISKRTPNFESSNTAQIEAYCNTDLVDDILAELQEAYKEQGNEDLCEQDGSAIYQDYSDFVPRSFNERLCNATSHGAYECNSNDAFWRAFQVQFHTDWMLDMEMMNKINFFFWLNSTDLNRSNIKRFESEWFSCCLSFGDLKDLLCIGVLVMIPECRWHALIMSLQI